MSNTITMDELFTGGKYPEFTVFYNIAFFNMASLIHYIATPESDYEKDKRRLETTFKKWMTGIGEKKDIMPDAGYAQLRRYLWKGYLLEKNTSGHVLTESDKFNIQQILVKLYHIRNFHSHYWHDNSELAFPDNVVEFINKLHANARDRMAQKYNAEIPKYNANFKNRPLFRNHYGKNFITREGRTFYLSFFLTRGQMTRFMQQRKGSKRNDLPEYKIKYDIYLQYTHREGAARHYFGYGKDVFHQLPESMQEQVWKARQGLKLISYLNDIPRIINDPDLFPLHLRDGVRVRDSVSISTWCRQELFFPFLDIQPVLKSFKDQDGKFSTLVKEQILEIRLNNQPEYIFHMSRTCLHKLILDTIRREDNGEKIQMKLEQFILERKELSEILTSYRQAFPLSEPENETLSDKLLPFYRYKLRSGKSVRGKLGKLLEKMSNDTFMAFSEAVENAPFEVTYYEFSFEENIKPRAEDHFTSFVVQFLMDFNLTPRWKWMLETFTADSHENETISKRKTVFSSTILPGYRLAITDNQVPVKINDDNGKEYLFLLGHRVLKNLLAVHLDGKSVVDFLDEIISDLKALESGKAPFDWSSLKWLTPNECPPFMKKKVDEKLPAEDRRKRLLTKASKRIEYIKESLKPFAEDTYKSLRLSRAEKNRQVMRCYLYFDWKYRRDGAFKFLRKNEYQQMSVYHYCLDKRGIKPEKSRYKHLLTDILPHMPEEVNRLLRSSGNLDELLVNTAKETLKILNKWTKQLPGLSGEAFDEFLSRIGISHNDTSTNQAHIPFSIHPILPVRVYYDSEVSIARFSLSEKVRNNSTAAQGLTEEHYYYHPYLKKYNTSESADKIEHKIVGKLNDLRTQDTLLWFIAKQYLKASRPDIRALAENHLHVGALRSQKIVLPFEDDKIGKFEVSLKYHQLDDFLLVESKPVIKRAIKQLFLRYDSDEKKSEIGIEVLARDHFVIPYSLIFQEIQRVYNESLRWAGRILNWERSVVKPLSEQKKANYQSSSAMAFIGFNSVRKIYRTAETDNPVLNTLDEIRSHAFHADIPENWSYQEMEKNDDLQKLLGFGKWEPNANDTQK